MKKLFNVFISMLLAVTMCTMSVSAEEEASAVTLSGSTSVNVGETTTLTAGVKDGYTWDTVSFAYSSGDESIATVDENGVVTGVQEGTVTITVTTESSITKDGEEVADSMKTASVEVTVTSVVKDPVGYAVYFKGSDEANYWTFDYWAQAVSYYNIADSDYTVGTTTETYEDENYTVLNVNHSLAYYTDGEIELTGTGTEADPYVVTTAGELTSAVSAGGYIQLGADIDLGKVADPALNFTKDTTLDLNNHKLSCNSYNSSNGDQHFIKVNSGVTLKVVGTGELNVNTESSWGYLLNNSGTVIFAAGTGNVMTLSWGYQFCSWSGTIKFREGSYNTSYASNYCDTTTCKCASEGGYYVVTALPDMCTVNGTAYNNLASAITAAKGTENPIILTEDYTCSTAIFDAVTIDGTTNGKTLTMTNSISAGTFTGNVVTSKTISGGTFNGSVTSSSTITAGIFNSDVTSTGTISGGTFVKDITAKNISGGSYDVAVTASGAISSGIFNKAVTAASISGGTFNDTATVSGAISGGTFSKTVSAASISNGTFNGAATVTGAISGGTFNSTANATSISGGVFTNQPENIAEGYAYAVNSNNSKYMVTSSANVTDHKVTNGAYAKYYGVNDFKGSDNTVLTANSSYDYVVKTADVKDGGLYKGIYNFSMSYVFADGYTMSTIQDADSNYLYIVGQNITTDNNKITSGTFLDDPTAYVDTTKYSVTSSEGIYTVSLKDDAVVATITETGAKYVTLQKALNAASDGQTVILQKDTEENVICNFYNAKTVTFDLNGHTLSSASGTTLSVVDKNNSKVFTIKDSSESKTGKVTATNGTVLSAGQIANNSNQGVTLNIEGGTFAGTTAVYAYSTTSYKTYVTINAGTFNGAMAKGGNYSSYTINSGTFSVDPSTISGATINGDVTHDETAGTYTVTPAYYTITAGTSEHGTVLVNGESSVTVLKNSTVTLTNTPDEGYMFKGYMNGETAISGTTITATADATITGVFSLKPYVNTTTNTVYASITDAFSAANDGETIKMQSDDTITTSTVTIGTSGKSVTLDLNGHTLDAKYDSYGTTRTGQINTKGTVTVTSSVDGGTMAANLRPYETLNISNVKFGEIYAGSASAVLNISSGEETSDGYINFSYNAVSKPVNITGGSVQKIYNAVVTISGGYIGGFSSCTGTISGGQFKDDLSSGTMVAAGYVCEAIPEGVTKLNDNAAYRVVLSTAERPDFVKFAESTTETEFTLTEDVDVSSYPSAFDLIGNKTIILNGHTLTLKRGAMTVSGSLTVNNGTATTQGSIVDPSGEEIEAVYRGNGATLTVAGSLAVTGNVRIYGRTIAIKVNGGGSLNLDGTTVDADYSGAVTASGGDTQTNITISNATISSNSSSVVNEGKNWSYTIRVNGKNIKLTVTNSTVIGVQGAIGVSGTGTTAKIRNCDLSSHWTDNDLTKNDAHAALYVAVGAVADVYDTYMYSPRANYAAYNGNNDTTYTYGTINLHSGCYLSDKGYNEEDKSVIAPADSLAYNAVTVKKNSRDYDWYIGEAVASITVDETTTYYATLADAYAAATDGDTIKLLTSFTEAATVTMAKNITLDLNGQTLTTQGQYGIAIEITAGKILTVDGTDTGSQINGSIKVPRNTNGNVVVNGGTYKGTEGATDGGYAPFYVNGNATEGSTLTINDATIIGLSTSGYNTDQIKQNPDNWEGVYLAGRSTTVLNNCTITSATTGVEVRAGSLTLNNCTITSTGNPASFVGNGNGGTTIGAAVAVTQHTTDYAVSLTVTGGSYTGAYSIFEKDQNTTNSDQISMNVQSGKFKGSVYSQDCTGFLSGGVYSATPDNSYVAAGKSVITNTDAETKAQYPFTIGVVTKDVEIKPATEESSKVTVDVDTTLTYSTHVEEAKVEIPDDVKTEITNNTVVSGVELEPEKTVQSGSENVTGVQAVVNAAKTQAVTDKNTAFTNAVAASTTTNTTVTVKVDVQVTPTGYSTSATGSTNNTITFDLTPIATVTIQNGSSTAVTQQVEVTNEMIDQDKDIEVKLYTGFEPAKLIHRADDGTEIATYYPVGTEGAANTFTYDSTTGVATAIVHHFSSMEAVSNSSETCVAKIGETEYSSLQAAVNAVKDGETITISAANTEDLTVSAAKSFTVTGGTFKMPTTTVTGYTVTADQTATEGVLPSGTKVTVAETTVTVSIYSRINGTDTSVATVSGGGNIGVVTGTTLSAPSVAGYTFKGWYTDYTKSSVGTLLSSSATVTYKPTADVSVYAVYELNSTSTFILDVTGSYFSVNSAAQEDHYKKQISGGQVTVSYTDSNKTFLYWVNGSGALVSTSASYTFTLVADTELKAVVASNANAGSAIVVFRNSFILGAQELQVDRYTYDGTGTLDITYPSVPSLYGRTFQYWAIGVLGEDGNYTAGDEATAANITAAIAGGAKSVMIAPKYTNNGTYIVTMTCVSGETTLQNTSYEVDTGKTYTLTAPTIEGYTFSYWKDADGTTVGTNSQYTVLSNSAVAMTAVYGDPIDPVSTINMVATRSMNGEKYRMTFSATFSIASGKTIAKRGFLYSTTSTSLTYDNKENLSVYEWDSATDNTGVMILNISRSSADYTVNIRPYVIDTDGNVTYGTMQTQSYNTISD